MSKYQLTYKVETTETIFVDADSLEDAVMIASDSEYDLKVITNLHYDATLQSVTKCG